MTKMTQSFLRTPVFYKFSCLREMNLDLKDSKINLTILQHQLFSRSKRVLMLRVKEN